METKPVVISSCALMGLALLALSTLEQRPTLIYNPSQSVEPGWYQISSQNTYERGDLVAASLPKWAENLAAERGYLAPKTPILKTIRAVEGDRYCITDMALLIADEPPIPILKTDSKMRPLPALIGGCRRVKTGRVLLISTRVGSSFDSRYFGEIKKQSIIGKAELIVSAIDLNGPEKREQGGARGWGAQGKIKGLCTKSVLQPCLHIDFYCTKIWRLAPNNYQRSRIELGLRLHQFPIIPDCSLDMYR